MKRITPGGRLAEIIARVPLGVPVLDVGTDHGIAAIALAQRGHAAVYASDIARGPLDAARRNAVSRGVADGIEFILADGVPEFLRGKIRCAVVAGMGGETIAGILARAPWLRDDGVTLVLQPQTKLDKLLRFLSDSGYPPPSLATVPEKRRVYTVLTVN